jgi:hypothetical protein
MRNFKTTTFLTLLTSAPLLVACNGAGGGELVERSSIASTPDAAQVSNGPGDVAPQQTAGEAIRDDWEAWVAAEVERIRAEDPELYNGVRTIEPRVTRARTLRFSDANLLARPEAGPLLLDRLVNGNEPDEVRAALVEAIGGSGAPFGPAIVDLFERERDVQVRRIMASVLRYADKASAHRGLRLALADADPGVRLDAAYAIGRRNDGAELSDALLVAAEDADAAVKQAAVQQLGALRVEGAKDTLVGLLSNADAEVRYMSLRALERIDSRYAASLPQARALRSDPDARVAKLATRLTDE